MEEQVEIWKRIPNFERYEASTLGRLKTYDWKGKGKEAIIKPAKDGNGYLRTMLKGNDGRTRTIKVHRIIAQTFIDNPNHKPHVNHKNFDRTDNRVENLEWVTIKENFQHTFNANRYVVLNGELNGCSKLTEQQVREIRAKYKPFVVTRQMLADEYGVDKTCIKDIVGFRTWKHLR